MNPLLQRKLESLQNSQKFECWYLVKHSTNFSHLCYLVSILKDYIEQGSRDNLETFIANKVADLNSAKPDLQLSNNYRALRVAAFFGLIKMMSSGYGDAEFTDTYNEITARCNGEYEHVELYQDIITRQIEKMYVSSVIDEGRETVRKDYAIYPIMFLNKVLVEIGKVSGSYSISMTEYKYLVATTKKFEDYLETMLYIKLLREDSSVAHQFETMRDKFDNRMNKAIELLEYLDVKNNRISLKNEYINDVARKVYEFESSNHEMTDEEYINFLCSTKSLFEIGTPIIRNSYDDVYDHNLYGIHIKMKNDCLNDDNSHICIGWSYLGDLSRFVNKDELRTYFEEQNPSSTKNSVGQNVGQLWRFSKEAKIGDYVIFGENNYIHIGRIESDYIYDDAQREDQDPDYVNNRKVKWIKTNIDRSTLSSSFHHSIGSAMSFFTLNDYKDAVVKLLANRYVKDDEVIDEDKEDLSNIERLERVTGGLNTILYGVPGAGKSFTIDNEYCNDENYMERVVFHPDYTYSDFVGQIMPNVDDDEKITYKFMGGPFALLMKKAYRDPSHKYYLIIEEINRGNAPAIFGDIFQLLDRDENGTSSYSITNAELAYIVYNDKNHKVRIPSNMYLLATMNTSDQNVFTLDTAFQRRWNMRLVENAFTKDTDEDIEFAEKKILDSDVSWETFCNTINDIILNKNLGMTSAEDKRLGTHFISIQDLTYWEVENKIGDKLKEAKKHNRLFAEKVIKYLWDDAFKFNRDEIFDVKNFNSLESIIKHFINSQKNERFDIFLENIKKALVEIANKSQIGTLPSEE